MNVADTSITRIMARFEQLGARSWALGGLLIILAMFSLEHAKNFLFTSGSSFVYRGTSHTFLSGRSRIRTATLEESAAASNRREGKVETKWMRKQVQMKWTGDKNEDNPFLPPIVYVTLSFLSEYPQPVLSVRVEGPGDDEHAASWFAPDICEQLGGTSPTSTDADIRWLGVKTSAETTASERPLTAVHFRVGFRPVAPGKDHMLHVRIEYSSRTESLFSGWQYGLTNTSQNAFVGKTLDGSPVIVVPKKWAGYVASPPGPLPLCPNPTGPVGKHGIWQVGYSDKNNSGRENLKNVREADADPAVKTKCNSNNRPHTSNDMWSRRGCRMQRHDPRCLLDSGGIVIAGDSVSRYMYYQLACELRALGASEYNISKAVYFSQIDGPLPNYINLQIESVCHHMRDGLSSFRKKLPDLVKYMKGGVDDEGKGSAKHGWQTLVINAGGLWQCTFGEDVLWKMYLHKVLDAALDAGFRRVLWASTTDVHPILYPNAGRKFWPLTKTRVEEVNAYALTLGRARGLEMVDYHLPTSLREMDPLEANDMRHFGQNTMHELSQIMLRATCSSPQDPSVAAAEKKWVDRGRVNEAYFAKGSHQEDFDNATRSRPCYTHYFHRKVRSYMKPCTSKEFPAFRGWQCASYGDNRKGGGKEGTGGIVVGRGECLGDPVHLDTCDKIIRHGLTVGKNLGYIEPRDSGDQFSSGEFNFGDNQFKLASSYCKCQPNILPDWQKGYFATKTGPFAEIDLESVLTSNNKPAGLDLG